MPDISTELDNISKARYGKDVRRSIYDAIRKVNSNLQDVGVDELLDARTDYHGHTYDSVGDAVRANFQYLGSLLSGIQGVDTPQYKDANNLPNKQGWYHVYNEPTGTNAIANLPNPFNGYYVGELIVLPYSVYDNDATYITQILLVQRQSKLTYSGYRLYSRTTGWTDWVDFGRAEAEDVRISASGHTYDSAGDAVRANFQYLGFISSISPSPIVVDINDIPRDKVGYYQVYYQRNGNVANFPDVFAHTHYSGILIVQTYLPYDIYETYYSTQILIVTNSNKKTTKMLIRQSHTNIDAEKKTWTDWTDVTEKPDVKIDDAPKPLSAKIFRRVGCIGDSYTAGYIHLQNESAVSDNPNYAWPHYMEGLTNNIWSNFGDGGSTAKSWVNKVSGYSRLDEVQAENNKCQAYVIGLMINDVNPSIGSTRYAPIGSFSDIGTNNDSFYAYYYKLLKLVASVNPDAKIFCNTCPKTSSSFTEYNQAVRDIVKHCHDEESLNVYLCDLADANKYYNTNYYSNPVFSSDALNGHYSPIGYEFMAECYIRVMSDVINENISEFQNVFKIPYDEPTA